MVNHNYFYHYYYFLADVMVCVEEDMLMILLEESRYIDFLMLFYYLKFTESLLNIMVTGILVTIARSFSSSQLLQITTMKCAKSVIRTVQARVVVFTLFFFMLLFSLS